MTTKFSQFPEGGNVRVGDKIVGLRDGENTEFNMPGTGIQDAEGNFLVAWSAADNAVNYMQYTNADTGDYPILETKGQDAAVGLNIDTKGNAGVNLNMGTGGLNINDSVAINEISDDDTFADASDETLQTSLATKTYVDTHGGDSVTLTSAGVAVGTTSLVNDGTGPALAIKGVVGGDNIAVTTDSTDTTVAFTGTLPIANGGTNNTSLGASGTLAQSDGSKINYTTATYPSTVSSNQVLYGSASNVVSGLSTQNSSALTTSQLGNVRWTSLGLCKVLMGTTSSGPVAGDVVGGTGMITNLSTGSVTIGLNVPVAIANGGTNNTSLGASGTLAQSDGSKINYTTATYPSTAGTSGTILQSNGTNIVNSTASYPGTATTSGTFLQADGTNWGASAMSVPTSAGSAGKIWISDGTNIVSSTPTFPNTATSGKIMRGDGTNWVETTAQYPDAASTSGNVLTSDGTNFVSSAPAVVPLTFNTVTGSTQAMAVNNCYYSTYAGTCVMTLPASAGVGSEIEVITDSSHVIQIAQNSGQLIYCGALNGVSQVTTTGTGGSITTTDPNTVIRLRCIVTNTTWVMLYATNPISGV